MSEENYNSMIDVDPEIKTHPENVESVMADVLTPEGHAQWLTLIDRVTDGIGMSKEQNLDTTEESDAYHEMLKPAADAYLQLLDMAKGVLSSEDLDNLLETLVNDKAQNQRLLTATQKFDRERVRTTYETYGQNAQQILAAENAQPSVEQLIEEAREAIKILAMSDGDQIQNTTLMFDDKNVDPALTKWPATTALLNELGAEQQEAKKLSAFAGKTHDNFVEKSAQRKEAQKLLKDNTARALAFFARNAAHRTRRAVVTSTAKELNKI